MRKKRFLAIGLVLAMGLSLVACGKKTDKSTQENNSTSSITTTESNEGGSVAEDEKKDDTNIDFKSISDMSYEEVKEYLATLPESPAEDFNVSTENMPEGECEVSYKGEDAIVIIPEEIDGLKVTKLRSRAFTNDDNVEVVKLASTITSIGHGAFVNCKKLLYVTGTENVESIERTAFSTILGRNETDVFRCVEFGDSVKEIEDLAFAGGAMTLRVKKGSALQKYFEDNPTYESSIGKLEIYE